MHFNVYISVVAINPCSERYPSFQQFLVLSRTLAFNMHQQSSPVQYISRTQSYLQLGVMKSLQTEIVINRSYVPFKWTTDNTSPVHHPNTQLTKEEKIEIHVEAPTMHVFIIFTI